MTNDKTQMIERMPGNHTPHRHCEAPLPSVIARLMKSAEAISMDGTSDYRSL